MRLRVERAGRVDRLLLGSAGAPAELGERLVEDLLAYFAGQRDASRRVVLVQGIGEVFCRGAPDGGVEAASSAARWRREAGLCDLFAAIRECAHSVLALVNGEARAEGFALALVCDATLASATARFGAILSRDGPSACSLALAWKLSQSAQLSRAWGAMISRSWLTAPGLKEVGLIDEIVEPYNLEARGLVLADMLLAHPSAKGLLPPWPPRLGASGYGFPH